MRAQVVAALGLVCCLAFAHLSSAVSEPSHPAFLPARDGNHDTQPSPVNTNPSAPPLPHPEEEHADKRTEDVTHDADDNVDDEDHGDEGEDENNAGTNTRSETANAAQRTSESATSEADTGTGTNQGDSLRAEILNYKLDAAMKQARVDYARRDVSRSQAFVHDRRRRLRRTRANIMRTMGQIKQLKKSLAYVTLKHRVLIGKKNRAYARTVKRKLRIKNVRATMKKLRKAHKEARHALHRAKKALKKLLDGSAKSKNAKSKK